MKRFDTLIAASLLFGTAAFGQYTNVLENAATQTVDTVWDASGLDILVGTATSNNVMSVISGGEVSNAGTLQVGAAGTVSNSVSVFNGGTVSVSNLVIHTGNDFNLGDGGALAMVGDFDFAPQTNLNWYSGGTLSVGGNLTGINDLDGTNRVLIIDGGTWSTNIDRTIGAAGSGNVLSIQNGGAVTNANGFVGAQSTASNNTVLVSGEGSRWVSDTLSIGAVSNAGNSVTVSSGGTVYAGDLQIAANNNFNLNGSGTLAMSGTFDASMDGFNWASKGTLTVGGELTGLAQTNGASYLAGEKQLVLNNGGSHVTTNDFILGYESSGNSLTITDGATASNADGYIGWGAYSGNNSVLVSGSNSAWTNNGNLYVGVYETNLASTGSGNSLTVTNDAWVFAGGADTNLTNQGNGGIAVASNATMVVGEKGEVLADGLFIDAAADFDLYGDLTLTGAFDADQAGFNWKDGGALTVQGALTNSTALGGANKTLSLDGPSASWDAGLNLLVNGSNTTFKIFNGAMASSTNVTIGAGTNDWNNSATVSGDGSVWSNSAQFVVGFSGSSNSLSIADGGRVVGNHGYVGMADIATGNSVLVSGTNSVWQNSGNLYVGSDGSGNRLEIKNTGRVESFDGVIGRNAGATNNTVLVDGGTWSNDNELVVGDAGANNTLTILGGGQVYSATGFVGRASGNNTVSVTDADSMWVNSGNLYVGAAGYSNNTVSVGGGGLVSVDDLIVADGNTFNINNGGTLALAQGFNRIAQSNVVWDTVSHLSVGGLLEGMWAETNLAAGTSTYLGGRRDLTLDGGQWLNGSTNLIVGYNGAVNSDLAIVNGGTVENADGYIGWGAYSGNNTVLVSGSNSVWNNSGNLYVGVNTASGNSLTVTNNAWVLVGGADAIGSGGIAVASNAVMEIGSGSDVLTDGLFIHENGTVDLYGDLALTGAFDASQAGFNWNDGADLSVGGVLSGIDSLSESNRTLTIAGGSWTTSATNLLSGYNNKISVEEGGTITSSTDAFIGNSTNDLGNDFVVSGSGSVWNVDGSLTIGANGSSNNTLTVSDQGLVDIGQDLTLYENNELLLESTGTVAVAGNMIVSNATVSGSGAVVFGDDANLLAIFGTNSMLSNGILFDGGTSDDTVAFTAGELAVADSLTNRFVNFEKLNLTNSVLSGSGTVDVFSDVAVFGGYIKPTGELKVAGNFTATDTILEVIAGAGWLHVTNQLDVSSMDADVTIEDGLAPAQFEATILLADGGVDGAFASTNINEHYLLYDFVLAGDSNVTVVAEAALDGSVSASPNHAALRGVRAGFNGMSAAVHSRTRSLRRNLVATEGAIPYEAYRLNAPAGARGPGDNNTVFGMHFWGEQFSGQGNYDADGISDGFDLNYYGTTFGLDRLFGDALVAGVNYTYSRSSGATAQGDNAETETYWVGLYSEWVDEQGTFVDALVGVGRSDYDTVRIGDNYRGAGKYEGQNFGGHVNVGSYFHHENWALAPYAGLHYLSVKSDGYTETETYGNDLDVGGTDVASLETAVGLKLRNRVDTGVGRLQTVGYIEWMHDFLNEKVGTTLSDGVTTINTARIRPEDDTFNAGIGFGWICTDSVEIGIGYDARFNDKYEEHMGTANLTVMF